MGSLARVRAFDLCRATQPVVGGIDVPGQGMMMWIVRNRKGAQGGR